MHPGMAPSIPSHVEIGGRRWRATDPSIPERLRVELVAELMAARRAVGAGQRAEDEHAGACARVRVGDAKIALGERGPRWWEPRSGTDHEVRLRATMVALLRNRAAISTICPSDVARASGSPDWRPLLEPARKVAAELHDAGVVEVRQHGARIADPRRVRGPMRIGRGHAGLWPPAHASPGAGVP